MSKAIERIKAKAEELREVRDLIAEIEEAAKQKTDELKAKREQLQTELILGFNKEGLSSIKTDDGSTYAKSVRKGVEVTNENMAIDWAIDNRAVTINKVLVKQKLEPLINKGKPLPDGFVYKEVEYISVRKPKSDKGEAEEKA